MKLNSKEAYEKIHLLSEVAIEDVKAVFEAILTSSVLNYAEGEATYLPGVGKLSIHYEGEEFVKEGKQAKIFIEIDPDDTLKKNIGQVVDKVETDVEKKYKSKIRSILNELLVK
jgi:hypothetical protein